MLKMITTPREISTRVWNGIKEWVRENPSRLSLAIFLIPGFYFIYAGYWQELSLWIAISGVFIVLLVVSLLSWDMVLVYRREERKRELIEEWDLIPLDEASEYIGLPEPLVKRLAEDGLLKGNNLGLKGEDEWYFLGESIMDFRERVVIEKTYIRKKDEEEDE